MPILIVVTERLISPVPPGSGDVLLRGWGAQSPAQRGPPGRCCRLQTHSLGPPRLSQLMSNNSCGSTATARALESCVGAGQTQAPANSAKHLRGRVCPGRQRNKSSSSSRRWALVRAQGRSRSTPVLLLDTGRPPQPVHTRSPAPLSPSPALERPGRTCLR